MRDWPGLPTCVVDGKPYYGADMPPNVKFVGMEVEPNGEPRYGKLCHRYFNKPCYETVKEPKYE